MNITAALLLRVMGVIVLGALALHRPAAAANTDKVGFLAQHGAPSEVISFDHPLADSLRAEYHLSGSRTAYDVMSDGWSPSVSIGTLMYGSCCWTATTWYGTYVSPSIYGGPGSGLSRIYVTTTGPVAAISLETSAGFYGLLPSDFADGLFGLPVDTTLSNVSIWRLQPVIIVPEPLPLQLIVAGLCVVGLRRQRLHNNKSPNR